MPEDPEQIEEETIDSNAQFIAQSEARTAVVNRLLDGPTSPQNIGSETSVGTGPAHRAVNELRKQELVEMLLPNEDPNGPVYGITAEGEKAAFEMETG